jgi:uncharacterized YccA/Bax inhibitor family protein
MRSSNPTLNENTFQRIGTGVDADKMTLSGTVNKSMILLGMLVFTAFSTYQSVIESPYVMGFTIGASILSFIIALITTFKPQWASVTAPIYAISSGVFLGVISALFEAMYPGIVLQAVLLTCATFLCLLFAYKSGFIKATENFKLGLFAATGAIAMIYMASWILSMFHMHIPYIHESGLIGIGFSLVVVVIAALNLVLDFDFIEQGVAQDAPKYMEWYASFSLLVTLIWLYIEILKLLAKLSKRD